jgi:hypothetical protein
MTTLRERIEHRMADLRAERAVAEMATPGPWERGDDAGTLWDAYDGLIADLYVNGGSNSAHIARQDPAATLARIDRELAGCAADLALLAKVEEFGPQMPPNGLGWAADIERNLTARYPEEDA